MMEGFYEELSNSLKVKMSEEWSDITRFLLGKG